MDNDAPHLCVTALKALAFELKCALEWRMTKDEATKLLGRNATEAAAAIGITCQAFGQWPDVLPARLVDRVQAALWRKSNERRKPRKAKAEA